MFAEKMDLRLPGPVQVPREIQRTILRSFDHPMMDYRTGAFQEVLRAAEQAVKPVFQTQSDVYILCGSGASALETAMVNLVGPDDTIVICNIGYFGDYLVDIAAHIGARVLEVRAEWGQVVDPDAVRALLRQHPEVKAVFATHCETSTGATNPVRDLAAIVRETDAVFVVDAVSSLAGTPLYMDAWGIDVIATGGQKALMLPPGIALVAVGEKAWRVMERHRCPSFYLDLKKYRALLPQGHTPYTPNIALVNGLLESCRLIEAAGGMEAAYRRHAALRDMTRAGVRALGMPLLVDDAHASPTLTSVVWDDAGMDADAFRKVLRETFHVAVGGGLGKLKGKLLRLGHMGYTDAGDVLKMLGVLELGLARIGRPVTLGAAVRAAQQVWLERPEC
ncbi:alanine--glyoxylate aminotransferase family protein [Alicyclobacillus sp.]|uniref:pyridoxal-phosphate-dependent aminotransferase family protein n=1 Tax=Alicyclobacillus sp. TaxID=61169 RepID=UPI0025BAA83E|nr:alanine--glyoxylate aminotransferase family protein [Alicyclobacillus sp.]MCL6517433.1 alanine--glyoxylate aminotransferase family protein [Alicyclobacillus sp.]